MGDRLARKTINIAICNKAHEPFCPKRALKQRKARLKPAKKESQQRKKRLPTSEYFTHLQN